MRRDVPDVECMIYCGEEESGESVGVSSRDERMDGGGVRQMTSQRICQVMSAPLSKRSAERGEVEGPALSGGGRRSDSLRAGGGARDRAYSRTLKAKYPGRWGVS